MEKSSSVESDRETHSSTVSAVQAGVTGHSNKNKTPKHDVCFPFRNQIMTQNLTWFHLNDLDGCQLSILFVTCLNTQQHTEIIIHCQQVLLQTPHWGCATACCAALITQTHTHTYSYLYYYTQWPLKCGIKERSHFSSLNARWLNRNCDFLSTWIFSRWLQVYFLSGLMQSRHADTLSEPTDFHALISDQQIMKLVLQQSEGRKVGKAWVMFEIWNLKMFGVQLETNKLPSHWTCRPSLHC